MCPVFMQKIIVIIAAWLGSPCPTLRMGRPNTPCELAHNPTGAGSQPLVSKLPRGVGLAD